MNMPLCEVFPLVVFPDGPVKSALAAEVRTDCQTEPKHHRVFAQSEFGKGVSVFLPCNSKSKTKSGADWPTI